MPSPAVGVESRSPTTPIKTKTEKRVRLLSYEEIPEWYRDNECIRSGYRPVSGSAWVSVLSWRYIHNETVNIFSHLLPAVAFLLGEGYILGYIQSEYPDATASDYFIFAFFLLAAFVCLGLSTTYHTLLNHSHEVERQWLCLDFVGIVLLTLGDFISGIYMRKIYWSMICSLGALTIFIMVNPRFSGRKWRTFRTLTFVATGLSGFAPLGHGVYLFGVPQMMLQSGMPYYLAEGGLLCLGALVYATRFPEALSPGRFDIWGASHQIFHILVVFATAVQLIGLLAAFDYNYHSRICTDVLA
ncbi:mPR-like GPCR protein [Diplogelasinospora grovesii]|uniref:MPR-like GPCR protein n=1 Tax=Diplogelasinospora grovesii TaxID=303347 RepID=A0AAN6MXA5_9PEZI|nr:mPR-like GPCR protein [Diplogelasinospora grovesii]